jgi:hypothetical protein
VAKLIWGHISEILNLNLGHDFESVARFWITNKNHQVTHNVSAAVLWSLWKFRNELCFQGRKWMGLQDILFKIARMLRRWILLVQQETGMCMKEVVAQLEQKSSTPPQLMWYNQMESSSGLAPSGVHYTESRVVLSLRQPDLLSESLDPEVSTIAVLESKASMPLD